MQFKDAIKYLRSELGITQVELAMGLNINAVTVGRWESGKSLPNRSITAVLLEFARSRGASKKCLDILGKAINEAAKTKLDFSVNSSNGDDNVFIRRIIDEADIALFVCDMETDEILYFNRKASEFIGAKDSATGKKCYECFMHRDTPCEFCHKSELDDKQFKSYDICRSSDGTDYRVKGKLIQWNGRKAQVECIFKNEIAPQKKLTAIDNTAVSLKKVFENINGGVSVVFYDSNGAVRQAYANERYYKLFGYTKEQFVKEQKNPHNTVHPDDWDEASAFIERIKETKQATTFRYRIIKRDNSIAYVRCSSSVTRFDDTNGYVMISVLTDITESLRVEQQALVAGKRLDAILKNMNSAVNASLLKADGTIEFMFCNDLFYEMRGYTKEQYQSEVKDPFGLAFPDDADSVRKTYLALNRIGDTRELQYRITSRDGKTKYIRARISVLKFPDAKEPAFLAVYADVTDIVEAREKLSVMHNQIADLLNDTPSGIAIVEVDRRDVENTIRTTYYNDRFISFSGYERDEYDALLKKNEMTFVCEEDIPVLQADVKKICNGKVGESVDTLVRCRRKDGMMRRLLLTGLLSEKRGDICVINIAMMDVTEREEASDRRRISNELLHIAAETDKRAVVIFDVKNNNCHVESKMLFSAQYGETFEDVPRSIIERGVVAPDSTEEFCSLFSRIRAGEKEIQVSLQMHDNENKFEWFECNSTTVYDSDGLPDHAVLVFHNITQQRIVEAVFKKWQQSIDKRPQDSYTLFRCNLSRDASIDEQDGKLLKITFPPEIMSFNNRTRLYASEYVHPDDRDEYIKLLDSDLLLAMFHRGEHFTTHDYREIDKSGEVMWRRLTVETVDYPKSTDVLAFLLYEDINEEKLAEIAAKEQAESDPLTGALNRAAFTEKVDEIINKNPNSQNALIIFDMDGFKKLNDTFGHAAGDQALQEVVAVLRSYTRPGDLVCRLGGDEFLVWLRDIPYDAVISKIAQQICEHIRKAYSTEVLLSASAGIAVYPRDGHSCDELYPNADNALYRVKQTHKGAFAFFSVKSEEQTDKVTQALSEIKQQPISKYGIKRRMLIVDDNETSRALLKNIFENEYTIETAKNGTEAMIHLRHFGASISVVLLDLLMPDIDGFSVLRKMQNNVDMRTIPVVVVTGDEEHATLLKAFELGAAEFVTKPVDVEVIRMRVQSVISKAESERLRAQNSYLMLQRDEEVKYRTVLESTGTVVIEYDWHNHVFIYGNEISKHIAGKYDHRGLWQVLLSDMVADSADVRHLQETLFTIANDKDAKQEKATIKLKTPSGEWHWFNINFYKNVDDYGLAEKLIITFNDVHNEVLASDKLLFQATRDELTGLYNRTGFLEKASELVALKEPGYYIMSCVDVEKFKVINDQYGIEKGDEVLRHIADTINGFFKDHEGICCRYTADKFAILYPAKLVNTKELAKNHKNASTPGCIRRSLRLRIGRCLVNETSLPISAMFDRATMAEEFAKARFDTNIIDYDESMRDNLLKEQQLVSDMVDALQEGEFEPWFQPQYNHATGALIGAEALVRWRKDGKIIFPGEFISVFEKNGFIYEVDRSIWRQVCALLRVWIDEGKKPVPVSVNISRCDMFQEDFVDVLIGLVNEYRLPAELLRLEITESAFSADTKVITDIAGKLISAGFTVEIDDFGSGYSSLNTLKDVPASIIKLDMRFFETTENSARGGNIIEAIVRMAKWLGLTVIAEGVEDNAQADYLKSIGCHYIQGYLYSKPLPVDEYADCMQESVTEQKLPRPEVPEAMDSDLFWNPKSIETLIFNSYVGGACVFELQGENIEILRYNDRYINELNGFITENADIAGNSIITYLDSESKKAFFKALKEALDSGMEASSEMRLTKDGKTEYVRQTSRLISKSSEILLYYCVILNVTEQRRLERERAESAEQLSIIMKNIDCGVSASSFHDENNIEIVYANDGYYKLFGYTEQQLKAEVADITDLILPEDREKTSSTVADIIRNCGSATYEYRCRKRDGSIIWVHTTYTVVSLTGMEKAVLLAVTTDITALRRAEEQSHKAADRMNAVMNAMTNGMTAVTVQEKIRFLFANDRFYKIYGIAGEAVSQDVLRKTYSMIHPDDRERIRNIITSATEVGKNFDAEYRIIRADGVTRYIKMESTVTALIGIETPVVVSIYTDITDEKNANEQIRFLNESASEILAQPDSEKAIKDTLLKLLDYFAGERAYIFELDDTAQTSDVTYEICALGITPGITQLKGVPYHTQQHWFDAFYKTGFDVIPDVNAMDESETEIKEFLSEQNIHSIIVAPLWRDGKLIGYLSVDNPTSALSQVSQLIALSDYIAVLLTRRDLVKAIENERQTAQQLMDDTPGGFVRVELFNDKNPTIVTVNNGLCKMLGMTKAEVIKAYGDNALACLAEDDAATASSEIAQAYATGGQYTCTCKLRKKDGSLLLVMLFGRFLNGESGKLYLNAYFTDITQQRNLEQLQSELLENLPFGAAMYEYDGKSLTAIHINKQYTKLVNREVDISLAGFAPIDAIYPDDRKRVFDEIRTAIAENRPAACDIRLLYDKDEYRSFHLDARIVQWGNGKYMLYVIYERITDRDKELKETSERLKLLSESIPGGIATFRCMPGNIEPIYFNDGICTLTGYNREEFFNNKITVLGLIFDEDKPIIKNQIELLLKGATSLDYSIRIHTKDGGYKWVECVASVTGRESENTFLISTVITDVTEHQEERERLRVSEELNRIAIDQSGDIISRYDVETRTLTLPYMLPEIFNVPRILTNMPEEQVRLGRVSADTAEVYCNAFSRIHNGEATGEATYQQNSVLGWRWLKLKFTTVFASDGRPVFAVITFEDITEQREKEAVYSRWQNAIAERSENSYTIVRCNLNKSNIIDSWEGNLLGVHFTDPTQSFNSRTDEYAKRMIYSEDRASFCSFLNSDTMLAEYHRGHRSDSLDYREQNEDGVIRWLRLSVDLVEYPDSKDVEAYMMFENIDEQKHAELSTIRRAETDPLTGVLNRVTFAERVNDVIKQYGDKTNHAMFLLDIDGFKQLNDIFGHGAGDKSLVDIANTLTRFCRKDDLVGRLGGDEFFVFISDIENEHDVANKAKQICDMTRKTIGINVHLSVSVGISLYPKNGSSFEELYKLADTALYRTKNAGKDGYSFVSGEPVIGSGGQWHGEPSVASKTKKEKSRRILIVDDDKASQLILENILNKDYYIETAVDGDDALAKLHHYGTAISAVLLDLIMPGMNGFEVLDKIQQDDRICTIPVIVVSADEDRKTSLRVISAGAFDLITKPVDADLLRIRVESAISKAENERLRAQNSFLKIKNAEISSYQAALERTGTMVITQDCADDTFTYSPAVSKELAGHYDKRPLWDILVSDDVTDVQTAHNMQQLVQDISDDKERTEGGISVRLKTASGVFKVYEMGVFEEADDYGVAVKMVITIREKKSVST